jgi:hypothetical protein
MKRSGKNIIVSILGLLLIVVSYYLFGSIKNNWMSMTFLIIVFGTLGINIIVWKQKWIFGKIEDLPILTVQFYYSEVFSTLRTILMGFVIAFSILWGTLYAFGREETSYLQIQTALLLIFLVYLAFASFYTFIQDFKTRIEE